ncbi:MAG: ligand-binding sensor domain-containing protein [Bacteroidia bacterium]
MKYTLNAISLFCILTGLSFCNGQEQHPTENKPPQLSVFSLGETVTNLGKDIGCIFQDRNNNYWFASNGQGVYRYDGKTLTNITDKNGLCSNFVTRIEEDINGNLWFSTRDGICRLSGTHFTNYTDTIKNAPIGKLKYTAGGLFFGNLNNICFYDGRSFTNFIIHPDHYSPPMNTMYRSYSFYSTLADKAGNVWFGTQDKGVCRYDGQSFFWLNEKDLAGPAVRCMFQDKAGNLWFGNNGAGLFRYDGKNLANITEENKLSNYEFLRGQPLDKPGSLARVWALNDDSLGNLWIGTIDAGVWKYDGTQLTNYTTEHGLSGNSIWVIYKDKKGELWFVANGEDIFKFNGKMFTKFEFGK